MLADLSIEGAVVEVGDFVALVVVVALLVTDGGLLGAAEVIDPECRVEALRSEEEVVFRSGDLGPDEEVMEKAPGAIDVLFDVAYALIVPSLSVVFVEVVEEVFLTVPLPAVEESIAGLVGGLFNAVWVAVVPGGPVRDLRDPVVFTAVVVRFGAAEVVEAAFFLSTTVFSFPVVFPSLSVS